MFSSICVYTAMKVSSEILLLKFKDGIRQLAFSMKTYEVLENACKTVEFQTLVAGSVAASEH